MRGSRFIKSAHGLVDLPVRYGVAVVAAGLAIGVMGYAAYHLWQNLQVQEARREVEAIVREAQVMQATARAGTTQTIEIDFPSSMRKAVFGARNPQQANRYYFLMEWGENHSYFAENVKFAGRTVLQGGIERVRLCVIENESTYVLIEVVE